MYDLTDTYRQWLSETGMSPDDVRYEDWYNVMDPGALAYYIEREGRRKPPWGGNTLTTGGDSGGSSEGDGGSGNVEFIEWPTDLYPRSYSISKSESTSKLPSWAEDWVRSYLAQYGQQLAGGLSQSLEEFERPVDLNEAEKQHLEYLAQENMRPIISNLAARGVLNSSTAQNTLSKVLSDLTASAYERAIANQQARINNYLKALALLESLVGTSKESMASSFAESTQANPWAPWSDLMDYIQAMKILEAR